MVVYVHHVPKEKYQLRKPRLTNNNQDSAGMLFVGTYSWDMSLGVFRLVTFAQDMLLGSFRLETLAWELLLESFRLGTLAPGSNVWGIPGKAAKGNTSRTQGIPGGLLTLSQF